MVSKRLSFFVDPFLAFRKFFSRGLSGLFFLDSSRPGGDGRFSYLGFSPFKTVAGNDLGVLKRHFGKYRRARRGAGLSSGAVGYWGYDGHFYFGFYNQVLVFDHAAKHIVIHAPGRGEILAIQKMLGEPAGPSPVIALLPGTIAYESNFSKAQYMAAVRRALRHIRKGDIYQINLSRQIVAKIKSWQDQASPLAIYQALREHSPSPFAAYFDDGRRIILSSSPERFLKLSDRIVQVKPMKGTCPRGRNKGEDRRFRNDLQKSAKEIAELLMVTDLERNDLGRVCEYGSVKVKAMRTIEEYQSVFQATATIEGCLRKDKDGFDLLTAAFPGGSVTGCPKIEAMKLIGRIEGMRRGAYTGILGYMDFSGDMDFSVLIRALFLSKDRIAFHVGGGIVADSDPSAEYEETCLKAKAMQAALAEVFY